MNVRYSALSCAVTKIVQRIELGTRLQAKAHEE